MLPPFLPPHPPAIIHSIAASDPYYFTKFGIWDPEIQGFIDSVYDLVGLPKQDVSNWLYSEGILVFLQVQEDNYAEEVDACRLKHGHSPWVTRADMLGNQFFGFVDLLDEFLTQFASNDLNMQAQLKAYFPNFISQTLEAHVNFYGIMSDVSNQVNDAMDQNPQMSKKDQLELAIDSLNAIKPQHPEFTQEIEDQITSIQEYIATLPDPNSTGILRGVILSGL